MRNAGPLFRNVVPWEAVQRRLERPQEPATESPRARLAREYEHFMTFAPIRRIEEIRTIAAGPESFSASAVVRAVLECGHLQSAGASGWYQSIRCLACYHESKAMQ